VESRCCARIFAHKVVYYAAKKGFWVYIETNGRLLRPDVADRLGDAGVAVFTFALDAWDLKPGLPKALVPARNNLEYVLRKQYVYDYMVFFNINICGSNLEDVRLLTDFAHERRVATDYHINETPMIEQDEHFKHLLENPTYIRPEDWRAVDGLIDWIMNNVIIRTDGTVVPCFPMFASTYDWGNIDTPKFDQSQLRGMKKTCQRHCFSTLNHNLAYCYNDARVIKWLWSNAIKTKFQSGVRSFED
jgi:hypothetical protein